MINKVSDNTPGMVEGLTEDIVATVYRYSDTMHVATALGCMVFAMLQIVLDANEAAHDPRE